MCRRAKLLTRQDAQPVNQWRRYHGLGLAALLVPVCRLKVHVAMMIDWLNNRLKHCQRHSQVAAV